MIKTPTQHNEGKDRHDPTYIIQYTLTIPAGDWDPFVESLSRRTKVNDALSDLIAREGRNATNRD